MCAIMYEYCEKIDEMCAFAYNKHCGIGKWTSERKDITHCDGKHPQYESAFLNKIKEERKKIKWQSSEERLQSRSDLSSREEPSGGQRILKL